MPTPNQSIEFSKRPKMALVGNNKHKMNIIRIKKYLNTKEDKEAHFNSIKDWIDSNTRQGISSGALKNVLGKSREFKQVGKEKNMTIWRLVE